MKCEHNRYTVSYMFRHFLSVIIREGLPDDTQEVPKHVGDDASVVFTFQYMYGRFDNMKMVLTVCDKYRLSLLAPQHRHECG